MVFKAILFALLLGYVVYRLELSVRSVRARRKASPDVPEAQHRRRQANTLLAIILGAGAAIFLAAWLYKSALAGIIAVGCYAVLLMMLAPIIGAVAGNVSSRRERHRADSGQ